MFFNLSIIHPSVSHHGHPSLHPPTSRSRQYASSLGQRLAASHKFSKSGQNGGRFFGSEEGRTERLQVSGPIGVRWWRIHLPKQTAQRSKVLHLSQRITPLSRPLVLQHLFQVLTIQNSCKHSMCKMVVVVVLGWWWGVRSGGIWNDKVQRSLCSGWS